MRFCMGAASALAALALAAVPVWAKPNISDLAYKCDSLGKRMACRELAILAEHGRDPAVRIEAIGSLADESVLLRIVGRETLPAVHQAAEARLAVVASGKTHELSGVSGQWKMTVNGEHAKTLTIDQSGEHLEAVIKEEGGEVKFAGGMTGKRSFRLTSLGFSVNRNAEGQVAAASGPGEGLQREIQLNGLVDRNGRMSGTMTIRETLNNGGSHAAWSNALPWVAER
jgi:hypothetical protein